LNPAIVLPFSNEALCAFARTVDEDNKRNSWIGKEAEPFDFRRGKRVNEAASSQRESFIRFRYGKRDRPRVRRDKMLSLPYGDATDRCIVMQERPGCLQRPAFFCHRGVCAIGC
jgi:hypothetical protein